MKKRSLLLLIIFGIFLFPITTFASDDTEKLFIDINVLDNGDIFVRELAVLNGEYNGRLRDIEYKNSNVSSFTGKESDFEGSSIYNGNGITDLKVYEVDGTNENTFYSINQKKNQYSEVDYAENGDSGVYELDYTANGISLKIYNPSYRNKSFYMEYIVKDVVVVHNDVAEIAWNILGNTYKENIQNMEVHVSLPGEDSDMRVWLHGPLNGEIQRVNNTYAKVNYDFLGAYNAVSVRVMFNKNLVPNSTKFSNVDGKSHIMAVEKKASEKANLEREKIKRQLLVTKIITYSWYILLIIMFLLAFKKKKDSEKTSFNMDYYRELPREYGPEILEYLLKQSCSEKGMGASILNLVDKKVLTISPTDDNKDYIFEKNEENLELTGQEKELVTLLINVVGDGKSVSLNKFKKYGSNSTTKAKKILNSYESWKSLVTLNGEEEKFYKSAPTIKVITIIIALLGTMITFFNAIMETDFILGYFAIFIGLIITFVVGSFKYKTEKGALEYKQWMAFKKFLLDFGTMDEKQLPEIALWHHYLVYASVLGCAKEVEKAMRMRMEQMNLTENDYVYYGFYHSRSINLTHAITSGVGQAVSSSRSSIAASRSSSSSGFGGGASGGGGSFGGGGGGGRF